MYLVYEEEEKHDECGIIIHYVQENSPTSAFSINTHTTHQRKFRENIV
jgi:hypothetical protein